MRLPERLDTSLFGFIIMFYTIQNTVYRAPGVMNQYFIYTLSAFESF